MYCAWEQLLGILPPAIRQEVDNRGRSCLQELRLRLGSGVEMVCSTGRFVLRGQVTTEMLSFVINAASRYSPWAAETMSQGYLTAPGGHRIGLAGTCILHDGKVTGIRSVHSLCVRVARDFPGISMGIPATQESVLILGPPGSGKTTLMRDLIRRCSEEGQTVAVVDERGELFPPEADFQRGCKTDVLCFAPKAEGMEMALRTMSPQRIAVDEITSVADCEGILRAMWCGVGIMATAHAGSVQDLLSRTVYKPLVQTGAFRNVVLLKPDKSWRLERVGL